MRFPVAIVLLISCKDAAPAMRQDLAHDAATDVNIIVDANALDVRDESEPTDMLLVPAGTFTMGTDHGGEADEHPAHAVTLDAFWLDRTPVTNADYAACIAAKVCRINDRTLASTRGAGSDAPYLEPKHPVNGVSWDDATTYCQWRGKRLPREAEYERAMRGDDGRKYAWGNDPATPAVAAYGRPLAAGYSTDDVGTHPAGRGPYGHDDLAGNVWEWCSDEYDPRAYTRKNSDRGIPGTCAEIMETLDDLRNRGMQGFTGSNPIPVKCEHVLRGGAFNYEGTGLRATNRVHHPGTYKLLMAGFRCAR